MEQAYVVQFLQAFCLTQAVEIPLVWYFLRGDFRRRGENVASGRILAAAFFANMATLPYLWFVYPQFLNFPGAVALGETTALVAEALLYRSLLGSSLRGAFITSLAANCGSVLAGLLVMPPF